MKKLTIRVTQEHIDKGEAHSCGKCPVALALRDAGFEDPVVGIDGFQHALRGGCWSSYGLLEAAKDFIHRFDAGLNVAPFEFEVPLPDPPR